MVTKSVLNGITFDCCLNFLTVTSIRAMSIYVFVKYLCTWTANVELPMWYLNCKCGTANVVPQLQMCQTAHVGAAYEANCECMNCKCGAANVVPQQQMWSPAFVVAAYEANCQCIQQQMLQLRMYELRMYNGNCESCKCSFTANHSS